MHVEFSAAALRFALAMRAAAINSRGRFFNHAQSYGSVSGGQESLAALQSPLTVLLQKVPVLGKQS